MSIPGLIAGILFLVVSLSLIHWGVRKYKASLPYYVPIANENVHFMMDPDIVKKLMGAPYRQTYYVRAELYVIYYHIDIYYIYSDLRYKFNEHNEKQFLTSVELNCVCDNYLDAKDVFASLKEKILKFYSIDLTYNDFKEDKKSRQFSNHFGADKIEFNITIDNDKLKLTILVPEFKDVEQ